MAFADCLTEGGVALATCRLPPVGDIQLKRSKKNFNCLTLLVDLQGQLDYSRTFYLLYIQRHVCVCVVTAPSSR